MDIIISKYFAQLKTNELYEIMALRQKVFVFEQNCPYLDLDGKDKKSIHLFLESDSNKVIAYARVVPPGISYVGKSSIGRVVVAKEFRNKGLGILIMKRAIDKCRELYIDIPIKISAQSYLQSFYESFGFIFTGEAYLEDGIPHIGMELVNE